MTELKKEGVLKALIVTGCLAERYKDEILQELPEVDAVVGTASYGKIVDAINEALHGKRSRFLRISTDCQRWIPAVS